MCQNVCILQSNKGHCHVARKDNSRDYGKTEISPMAGDDFKKLEQSRSWLDKTAFLLANPSVYWIPTEKNKFLHKLYENTKPC